MIHCRWSYLEVYTEGSVDDLTQAYAAGLVEGQATRDLMSLHWYNTMEGYCKAPLSAYCSKLKTFLRTNFDWVASQVKANMTDPYWHQVHNRCDSAVT